MVEYFIAHPDNVNTLLIINHYSKQYNLINDKTIVDQLRDLDKSDIISLTIFQYYRLLDKLFYFEYRKLD